MGFFDYLTAPKQDISQLQGEQADLRKKKLPPTPAANPFQNEESELASIQDPGSAQLQQETQQEPTAKPDVRVASSAYRAKESDLVKREGRTVAEIDSILGSRSGAYTSPYDTELRKIDGDIARVRKAITSNTLKPGMLAQDIDVIVDRIQKYRKNNTSPKPGLMGMTQLPDPIFHDNDINRLIQLKGALSGLAEERVQLDSEKPEFKSQAIPSSELSAEATKLQQAAEKARIEAQNMGLLAREPKIREVQNLQAQAAALNARAQEAKSAEEGGEQDWRNTIVTSLDDDPDKGAASAGVSPREYRQSVNESVENLRKQMGPDFDVHSPVSFKYALPYVIQSMGPEAQIAFTQWLKEIKRKEAEANGKTPDGQNPAQDAGKMAGEPISPNDQRRAEIQANMAQQKQARMDLAEAQELQSWPAIVAFVLLGVLIGPQGAFAFFSNSKKKNQLKLWLQQLEMERKYLLDEEKYEKDTEREIKREAARRMTQREDKAEQRQFEMGKLLVQHRLIIERAQRRQNPETAVMKKLSGEFSRAMGLAAKYSPKNYEFSPDAEKSKAAANFEYYMRKAAEIDVQLREIGAEELAQDPEQADE